MLQRTQHGGLAEAEVAAESDGKDKCVTVVVLLRNSATVLRCCAVRRVGAEILVEVSTVDDGVDVSLLCPAQELGEKTSVLQGTLSGTSDLYLSLLH